MKPRHATMQRPTIQPCCHSTLTQHGAALTAQHSTAQHSTAQHSTAAHSAAQRTRHAHNVHVPLIVLAPPATCRTLVPPALPNGEPLGGQGQALAFLQHTEQCKQLGLKLSQHVLSSSCGGLLVRLAGRSWSVKSPASSGSACLQHQARKGGGQLRPPRHAPPALVLKIVQLGVAGRGGRCGMRQRKIGSRLPRMRRGEGGRSRWAQHAAAAQGDASSLQRRRVEH